MRETLQSIGLKEEQDGFNLIFRFDSLRTIIFCKKGESIANIASLIKGTIFSCVEEIERYFIATDARERCLRQWQNEASFRSGMRDNDFRDGFLLGWHSAKGEFIP